MIKNEVTIKDVNLQYDLPHNVLYDFLKNIGFIYKEYYVPNSKKTQYRLTDTKKVKDFLEEKIIFENNEYTQYRVVVTNSIKLIKLYNKYKNDWSTWNSLWIAKNL